MKDNKTIQSADGRKDQYAAPIVIGPSVPRRKSKLLKLIGRIAVFLLGRWSVVGQIPDEPKMVIVVGPHTSNWDFPVAMATVFKLGLKVSYFGKDSLFKGPFGGLFRALGGIPINRDKSHGVVGESRRVFSEYDKLILAIAPEGTRSRVSTLKTGFQQIAKGANVPIMLVAFDYSNRRLVFSHMIQASDNQQEDVEKVIKFFDQFPPKKPENWGCSDSIVSKK